MWPFLGNSWWFSRSLIDLTEWSCLSFKLTYNPALSNFMAPTNVVTCHYLHSLLLGRLKTSDISFMFYSYAIIILIYFFQLYWDISLAQFSHSIMSDSLWLHGLQHARPPCPSPASRAYLYSCPMSWSCHSTISSSCALLLLPSMFPSIRVFSNEWVLSIRWPRYWRFSFRVCPSSEYSGLILFKVDWLDLLAVQGTLKSIVQHHSPKASNLWCSAFFIAQLSHPYITAGKNIALTRWIFAGKVISLLFNMLSILVIVFLPRNKHLSISRLQSPFAVIWSPPK